jgi:hypothetical protein
MSKRVPVVALLAIVGIAAYVASNQQSGAAAAVDHAPPADAEYTYDPADLILMSVVGSGKSKRTAAADSYMGLWNSADGWEGEVVNFSSTSVRLRVYKPGLVGGEYAIVAKLGTDPEVKTGQTVWVQGRIANITSKAVAADIHHIIELDPARIVRRQ